jgi:hypothetical protein
MKRSLIALALAAALPLSAQATDLKYNYVEADYASTHAFDTTADGYRLKGSVGFGEDFYGIGSYSRVSKNGVDFNEGTLGLGYRHAISDKADWVSELSYVNDEFDAGSLGNTNDNGYRIATGVRGMLGDKFEGNFNINYTDVNDFGNGVGAGVGGLFHINDMWGVAGGYDYSNRDNSDVNTWTLGVRASF